MTTKELSEEAREIGDKLAGFYCLGALIGTVGAGIQWGIPTALMVVGAAICLASLALTLALTSGLSKGG